jgi:hypothetical protein
MASRQNTPVLREGRAATTSGRGLAEADRYSSGNRGCTVVQESRPAIPAQINSRQALVRIALRLVLLTAFASVGSQGFGNTFATLLTLSAIFCAIVAVMRREAILCRDLTHWDEAAIYAVLSHLLTASF